MTYELLDIKSNILARGLESIGVKKGDRVAVMLGNGLEYATVWFEYRLQNPALEADHSEGDICVV